MTGNDPEVDGVDHRVEPQPWLAGGAADGADTGGAEDQPYPADDVPDPAGSTYVAEPAGEAGGFGQDHPNGTPAENRQPPLGGEIGMAPPYPAQLPPVHRAQRQPARGLAARLAVPFLARSRTRAAKPQRPQKGERSSRPMTARVTATAPAQVSDKTAVGKPAGRPTRPPKGSPAGPGQAGGQQTRKAQLILSRIEPWSVMKFSFMVSLVGWVILFVAVTVLYFVLSKLGVFHAIQSTVSSVTSSKDSPGADASGGWFSASRILGYTMLVGAVNVILITALATVGAVVYNLVTHIAGGIEVTLKETD
jgi:Transmembrane domain of unknown function (DUF3566)